MNCIKKLVFVTGLVLPFLNTYGQTLQSVTDNGNNVTTNVIAVKGNNDLYSYILQNAAGKTRWGLGIGREGDVLYFHHYNPDGTYNSSPLQLEGSYLFVNGESRINGGGLELGPAAGQAIAPFIDFHYGNGSLGGQDFNVRLHNYANNGLAIFSPLGAPVTLRVVGNIITQKVKVQQDGWADYVFAPGYKLPSLQEIEQYVKVNRHLPDVPSEKEVQENGVDVGEMNKVLLKKVEELTLYLIEQQKELKEMKGMKDELEQVKQELKQLRQNSKK